MKELRYAVICVDDDPMILQVLAFQLDKILDSKKKWDLEEKNLYLIRIS